MKKKAGDSDLPLQRERYRFCNTEPKRLSLNLPTDLFFFSSTPLIFVESLHRYENSLDCCTVVDCM
jgi:hypothetical protein